MWLLLQQLIAIVMIYASRFYLSLRPQLRQNRRKSPSFPHVVHTKEGAVISEPTQEVLVLSFLYGHCRLFLIQLVLPPVR